MSNTPSQRLVVDEAKVAAALAAAPGGQRLAMALSWAMEFTSSASLHALVANTYNGPSSEFLPSQEEIREFLAKYAPDKLVKIVQPKETENVEENEGSKARAKKPKTGLSR
jgi:hypothetical protein